MSIEQIEAAIRDIHDFPKPGIVFKDITPVLQDPNLLRETASLMIDPWRDNDVDYVVGIESRGFIFGSLMALEMDAGFVPIRKPSKLPAETVSISYQLEYGTDTLEMHRDAVKPGQRVLVIDDLIATGGSAVAAVDLLEGVGADVVGCSFMIELAFLKGREKLGNHKVTSLISVS